MTHPYETLFNQFNDLGLRFQLLRGIVQNDVPVAQAELDEFRSLAGTLENEMRELVDATAKAVKQENPSLCLT